MIDVCGIQRCDRPVVRRGWCEAHYTRWRRSGSPTGPSTYNRKTEGPPAGPSGRGKLSCNACGQPLGDHSLLEPCPASGLGVVL